jgi:hypothetical protein
MVVKEKCAQEKLRPRMYEVCCESYTEKWECAGDLFTWGENKSISMAFCVRAIFLFSSHTFEANE